MDNTVFVVKAPNVADEGRYVLLVNRGGVMGSSSSAFIIDAIRFRTDHDGKPHTVEALDAKGHLVTHFTYGTMYTLVRREQVEFMTALEAAKQQKAEEEEVNKIWKTEQEAKSTEAEALLNKAYL